MSPRSFDAIDWRSLELNPSALVNQDWMLVTPGRPGSWNTMTASWGGFGHLWNMDVAFVFVRPSRFTFGFMEREEGFTLSFFGESMRKSLEVCGSLSGRDCDKAAAAGITPRPFAVFREGAKGQERVGFEEARLVLSCRKAHAQDLDPAGFVDPAIASGSYPRGDIHRLYVGAIEGAWTAR